MKRIIFISLMMGYITCFSQITFEKTYTITGNGMHGMNIMQNNDGSFLILANAWPGGFTSKGSLLKTDSIGNILWAKLYSESFYTTIEFTNFEKTPENSYLISGNAQYSNSRRLFLMKVDSSGNIIWSNCYGQGVNNLNAGFDVKVLSDGNYLICGSIGAGDFYLVKTDTAGNTLWSRTLGAGGMESAIRIEITANGNFVIMGQEDIIGTTVAEFDNNGNIIWNKTYILQNSSGLSQWAIRKCPDNGFAIAGVWISNSSNTFWPYLLKTDSSGNALWCKLYTTTAPGVVGEFFDIRITSDSGFILTWEPEYPCQYCRTGLIKTDSLGNIAWSKNYNLNEYTFPSSAIQTFDLGYAIVGNNYTSIPTGISFIKTGSNGETGCYDSAITVVPINLPVSINTYGNLGTGHVLNAFNPFVTSVSVIDTNSCLPTSLFEPEIQNHASEIQIFPNPTRQRISITAQKLQGVKAEIYITDLMGQILLSKEENTFGDGNLSSIINIDFLSGGIYLVIVRAGEYSIVKKLVVQ